MVPDVSNIGSLKGVAKKRDNVRVGRPVFYSKIGIHAGDRRPLGNQASFSHSVGTLGMMAGKIKLM